MPLAVVLTSRRRLARRLRRTTNGCCFRDAGDTRERACEAFVVANDAAITFPREEESRKEEEDMRGRKSDERSYVVYIDVVYKLQKRSLLTSSLARGTIHSKILSLSLFIFKRLYIYVLPLTRRTCPSNTKPTRRRTRRIRCSPPRSFPTS